MFCTQMQDIRTGFQRLGSQSTQVQTERGRVQAIGRHGIHQLGAEIIFQHFQPRLRHLLAGFFILKQHLPELRLRQIS